ncbi:MAG: transcription antiterminator [Leptotrichiaceae bacterium]|nr:transcription antiterminator [Leptotrichiaceae bacterium]MBP6280536.1 transcription antiterminator [Leptotrichiaceae bacterium]MBP7100568.1 transcription antiterminator [Leptotrichiaceae bacterium]MBP9629512.1 transcription antiterminator [Leptotrichiaceae bacterium]
MNNRMKELVELISINKYKTAEELSKKLNVSTKTVRTEIKNLNSLLIKSGAEIVSKSGYGYILKINNKELFSKFDFPNKKNIIPDTSKSRIQYIIEYLINIKEYVKVEDLSKILFTSPKTLAKDIKEAEKILNSYNIKLERKPYYGIKLKGEEFDIRLCIADYVEKKTNGIEHIKIVDKNELKKIATIIMETLKKENFNISDVAFQNLIIHIQIALKRIENNCYVPVEEKKLREYISEKEFQIAKKCTYNLEKIFKIKFPESEIGYIAIHLAGKKIFKENKIDEKNFIIDQEISNIVNEMLKKMYDAFKFDFSKDLELRIALAQHLMPLRIRVRFDMKMKNPMLDKIKERFSLAYAMAKYASTTFYEYYNKNLSEDEVGYIALNLALALERQRKDINKKTVLLVCSSGKGSAELLAYTYKEAFGEYIEELITCSVYDLESMDFSKIDYVFTTVPINIKVPIPIQEVEYFLEESNIRDIKKIFTVEEKDNFLKYYDNDLFLSNICLKTKEEILKYMVNHIKKYKIIPNNFLSSIKKREKLGITEFGNKIAMPHPDKTLTEESFVCVGILENPIIWEKKEVQVVFLVSVSKKTDKKLKYFYKVTAKFLLNKKNIEKLIKSRKYEDLILMLKNIEEKMEDETNE